LDDVVISHLEAPVALLTNRSEPIGHYLSVSLVGVSSSRDALGATVEVTSSGRTLTRQLTAGDGYQASNERRLIFGLGDNPSADELRIRWPSGAEQSFAQLQADREYLLIEGADEALAMQVD
jgi:hypothetical protein